jgi:hypothetical protein
MTTSDREQPGLLLQVAMAVATLAEAWLRSTFMFMTLVVSVGAMLNCLFADAMIWGAVAVVPVVGGVTALMVFLVCHGSPVGTWLTMLTVATFDVGVIHVLLRD